MNESDCSNVVVITGGVGGVKLVDGLHRLLGDRLTAIVNTGDDFIHWGLPICPDLDTVMYTLAGLADVARGWGLADESFACLDMVRRLGGESWFNLGDKDLATHLMRARWLAQGLTLTEVTARLNHAVGVTMTVLPMTDAPRPTSVITADGRQLPFQRWLVQERAPQVRRLLYEGATEASASALGAIERADALVIAPSNPYVSIEPFLTLDGVREAVARKWCVAVSPIVAGEAVKGPLAQMLQSLQGQPASAQLVAQRYDGLVDCWVVEHGDGFERADASVVEAATVMRSIADRVSLAEVVLQAVGRRG